MKATRQRIVTNVVTAIIDGLVKIPSVPLGAGLRFNFVVVPRNAGYVRLTPQFLRALQLELFTKPAGG